VAARASISVATLAQPISSTNTTAPSIVASIGLTKRRMFSSGGATVAVMP
jgi:hypothetical protein